VRSLWLRETIIHMMIGFDPFARRRHFSRNARRADCILHRPALRWPIEGKIGLSTTSLML
jgi:hypothetical protein